MKTQEMDSPQGATRQLARFASELRLEDVPAEVIAKLKSLMLDQLGAEIAAVDYPWTQSIKRYAETYSAKGKSVIIVSGERLDAEFAALANGTFGHGFEIDDYHPAPTHIGCVAVPAALAVGLEQESSGAEMLLAALVSFEITARVASATMPSMIVDRGFHASCAHGVFGAAASTALLMGLTPDEMLMSLSLAGSHASGTTEFAQTGGDVKRFHAGMGAAGGIRAARAAAFGMTGPPTILEGKRGILQAFSERPRVEALTEGLGEVWSFTRTAIKPYTVCGLLNPQIDALRSVMAKNAIRTEDIERIVVGADRFALVHVGSIGPNPTTTIKSQFSTHFSLAMSAVLGANDFATYQAMAESKFSHPGVLAIANRIEVVLDPECDKRYPDISKASVTVTTKDGRTFREEAYNYRDLPREEIHAKFHSLATRALTAEQAKGIVAAIDGLERYKDVTELLPLLLREGQKRSAAGAR